MVTPVRSPVYLQLPQTKCTRRRCQRPLCTPSEHSQTRRCTGMRQTTAPSCRHGKCLPSGRGKEIMVGHTRHSNSRGRQCGTQWTAHHVHSTQRQARHYTTQLRGTKSGTGSDTAWSSTQLPANQDYKHSDTGTPSTPIVITAPAALVPTGPKLVPICKRQRLAPGRTQHTPHGIHRGGHGSGHSNSADACRHTTQPSRPAVRTSVTTVPPPVASTAAGVICPVIAGAVYVVVAVDHVPLAPLTSTTHCRPVPTPGTLLHCSRDPAVNTLQPVAAYSVSAELR